MNNPEYQAMDRRERLKYALRHSQPYNLAELELTPAQKRVEAIVKFFRGGDSSKKFEINDEKIKAAAEQTNQQSEQAEVPEVQVPPADYNIKTHNEALLKKLQRWEAIKRDAVELLYGLIRKVTGIVMDPPNPNPFEVPMPETSDDEQANDDDENNKPPGEGMV